MSEQEFLKSVKNADISPKMYKAINTQTARYFEKSNEYVIDFELYQSIDDYKSFTPFEKAVIAYRANERLSGYVFSDSFLSFWEHKVKFGGASLEGQMALIFETKKYRNKVDKDFIILVLQIDVEDEDYREPVYVYKTDDLYARWHVSFNKNFFNEWEQIVEEI